MASTNASAFPFAIEPIIEPLGFDWKIGVGLLTSFAAREVMVSTLATLYNVEGGGDDIIGITEALKNDIDPATGSSRYTPLVALSIMVFFVYGIEPVSQKPLRAFSFVVILNPH